MKLIAIYIEQSKAINELLLPLDSNFIISFNNETLHIKHCESELDHYYQGNNFNLLLGENGTGKTTILDYIESMFNDSNDIGFSLWFHKNTNEYHLFDNDGLIKKTESDFSCKKYNSLKRHLHNIPISLLKLSNVFDLNKYAMTSSRGKSISKKVLDLTNNAFLKKSKRNIIKEDIKNEFFYVESVFSDFTDTTKNKPNFIFSINKGSHFSKIFQRSQTPKSFSSELQYFNENINNQLNNPSKSEHFKRYIIDNITDDLDMDDIPYLNLKDSIGLILSPPEIITTEYIQLLLAPYIFKTAIRKFESIYVEKEHHSAEVTFDDPQNQDAEDREDLLVDMILKYYLAEAPIEEIFIDNLIHYRRSYTPKKYNELKLKNRFLQEFIMGLTNLADYISELINTDIVTVTENARELSITIQNYHTSNELITLLNNCPVATQGQFSYGWEGMSSGEAAKLKLLSRINHGILTQRETLKSKSINHVILIDEIDLYIHPEWQRVIIQEIIEYIDTVKLPDEKFQFIITTHSPIVASDILPNDITCLYKENSTIKKRESSFGFGTSISDLYYNSFSLNSTIGEHSKSTIDKIIARSNSNNLTNEDVRLIHKIGDDTVKKILLKRVQKDD